MEILSILGAIICLVGVIFVLIEAFKTSIIWGLVALFGCGIGWFVYVATHWQQSKKGFLLWVAGVVIQIIATMLGGGPGLTQYINR